ncbi:ATP-binding cassette domain-containing protein [Ferruginibacter lapsinanis]|uniref:ABC transporter ATP-binding protein n=1 Tax=Ferruginibacter lapsinanis TaxID=563172 RepID=UPI001E35E040|nr:ABC transporter transmembrane domain-containing protein [Ferruginibacter lapsinanis]UEG50922.1 ATP-binding cassette domain-containing protein [Ferruginibacter lapsinanis]
MKNFLRVFKYIHIPKEKLALYICLTLLATVFSLLSIGMLSPFLNLIFNTDVKNSTIQSNAIGDLKNYFQQMIVAHDKIYTLAIMCVVIVIATFLKNLFLYLSFYVSTPVRNNIISGFRIRLYNRIVSLPLGFFSEQRKGDLMSRMVSDIGEIYNSIIGSLEGLIKDSFTIIGFLCYMIYLSPQLSLFLLLLLPVTVFVIGRISKRLKKESTSLAETTGSNLSHVEETLGGMKVIKAFTAEEQMMEKFKHGNNKLIDILNSMTRRRDLASPLTEVLSVTVLCIILFVGGKLVFSPSSQLASGDLITFILSFAMLINPAKNLAGTIAGIQRGMGALDRVEEILNAPVTIVEKPDAINLETFEHSIEFKNVSFSYGDKTVLHNIDLIIPKGKTIALVGSSGSGKSTLVDLIPRFHNVSSGEILVDGKNINEYTLESLRKQMSFVTQEPILFNDTIANNIALGKLEAPEETITHAAKVANAYNFIVQKEKGFETNIGDRGTKLSGGERQRLTIARAVLQNSPILILDEATSSLDTESERLVQEAINNLMRDRTSVVIAHRLSTISNADEIIVLQNGRIIERGNHQTLIDQNGFYSKLVEMQEIK